MSLEMLLDELAARGVQLSLTGDGLSIDAPAGAITPDLRAALVEYKPDLLRIAARPVRGVCVRCGAAAAANLTWHCQSCAERLHADQTARNVEPILHSAGPTLTRDEAIARLLEIQDRLSAHLVSEEERLAALREQHGPEHPGYREGEHAWKLDLLELEATGHLVAALEGRSWDREAVEVAVLARSWRDRESGTTKTTPAAARLAGLEAK